jgi:hypothetical protein
MNPSSFSAPLRIWPVSSLVDILYIWCGILKLITDEAHQTGRDNDWVNQHPINVLFAAKVAGLTCANDDTVFAQAFLTCLRETRK